MLKLGIIKGLSGISLSSIMQTEALQHLNILGEYKVYEATSEQLEKLFKELKANGVKGVNVTIPHKVNIVPFIDELTERAKLVGAVNTITFQENGKTIGDNTDVVGFWEGIPQEIKKEIPGKNVAILGCGGAACAVAIAFLLNNVSSIKIYGRNKDKLKNFKQAVQTSHRGVSIEIDLFANIDLLNTHMLVNTTPLGMSPNINLSPVTKEELGKLPKDSIVYDIIYNPQETKLLKDAKSLNLKTINGIDMLVRQGAESLNIWLGKKVAPVQIMKNALRDAPIERF